MNNKILTALSSVCMLSLLFACNNEKKEDTTTVVTIDKEQIKNEIQAKEDSFAAIYNRGEVKDIGYYADDAVTYFQNRPPLVGRAAIAEFLHNDIISNSDKITFKTKEVFVSSDGNQVVGIGAFTLVDSANNVINTGNYMSLFEKRNGKYVSVRDMSTSDGGVGPK